MYQVIDIQTQQVKGTYQTRRRAYARADKLDAQYGAVRYVVRMAPANAESWDAEFAFARSLINAAEV